MSSQSQPKSPLHIQIGYTYGVDGLRDTDTDGEAETNAEDTANGSDAESKQEHAAALSIPLLVCLVLVWALALVVGVVLSCSTLASSLLLPISSPLPSTAVSLVYDGFRPPAVDSSCLCLTMYDWSPHNQRDRAYPHRVPWRLSPSRSYAQWDACSMLVPRSQLISKAPALPGPDPDDHHHTNSSRHVWQLPSCIAYDVWVPAQTATFFTAPVFSLQFTVFNQEELILPHLTHLIQKSTEPFEIVVVFDDCTDHSIPWAHALLREMLRGCRANSGDPSVPHQSWAQEEIPGLSSLGVVLPPEYNFSLACVNPSLVHARTIIQPTSVWEATANNIGARAASPQAEFLVFVQDDMMIRSRGWNSILAVPARLWAPDVMVVSGLCSGGLYSRRASSRGEPGYMGRCLGQYDQIRSPLNWDPEHRCVFYIRDNAIRGPLLIVHEAMKALGYFDEVHFILDGSELDFSARVYYQKGGLVGHLPIDFTVDPSKGATRKPKPALPPAHQQYHQARVNRTAESKSILSVVFEEKSVHWAHHDENRPLTAEVFHQCLSYYWSGETQQRDWFLINASRHRGFV